MANLFLLRHLKSQWNKEDRFAGWSDGPLCEEGIERAEELSKKVFQLKFDTIYTSPLFRNQDTVARIFDFVEKYPLFIHLDGGKMEKWGNYVDISENDVPVHVSEKLNERYYGKLQGEDKDETAKKHGAEKVHLWRRSFKIAPPGGETLKDTYKRSVPFYRQYIEKDLRKGKSVLVDSSHNPLRALMKYIEKISDEDIINVEVAYGSLIEYQFDEALKLKNKRML